MGQKYPYEAAIDKRERERDPVGGRAVDARHPVHAEHHDRERECQGQRRVTRDVTGLLVDESVGDGRCILVRAEEEPVPARTLGGRLQQPEVAFAGAQLELEEIPAGDLLDPLPLDRDGPHVVGRVGQLAPVQLFDLTGDAVAVLQDDNIGLLGAQSVARER